MPTRRAGGSNSVTVGDLAAHYGSTARFIVLALQRLGIDVASPDDWLTPRVQATFEDAYGDKIRAAAPPPPSTMPVPAADQQRLRGQERDRPGSIDLVRDTFSPARSGNAFKLRSEPSPEQIAQRQLQETKDRKYAVPRKKPVERFPAEGVTSIYLGGSPGAGRRS